MKARMRWADVAIDQETRKLIKGSVEVSSDGTVTIRLPHKLESPNKLLHAHWRERTADKKAWAARLRLAIANSAGMNSVAAFKHPIDALKLAPVFDKRIVRIERQLRSSREFIRDDDNLVYSGKALLDLIRQFGFIRDDNRKYTELHVTQRVSDDRRHWTVIRIEVAPTAAIPLMFQEASL